ncbi:unnamed protein product [Urochloa humidicola]
MPMLLLLLLAVAVAANANPGVAFAGEPTSRHLPPLLDCTPPPPTHNDSSFRANLASALAALPAMVAAASEGVAFLEPVDAGPDRVFARGGCFGQPASGGSSWPGACVACLKAAARDLAGGCRGSRRAGAWRDGCFMAYTDTDTSLARENAFRGWFYAPGSSTPLALAYGGECMVHDDAECYRCIDDLLRAAPPLGWLWRLRGGDEVVLVSYTCFQSFKIPPNNQSLTMATFWTLFMLAAEAVTIGVLFCLIILTLI